MKSATQIVLGFMLTVAMLLLCQWFLRHYYQIGPEFLEPLVLVGGLLLILSLSGLGVVVLVHGIRMTGNKPDRPIDFRIWKRP